jgi:hypothetical protein
MRKLPFLRVLGFASLLAATFAAAQPPLGAPRSEAPIFVPAGSSWVNAVREFGSFGSANEQRVTISRGEQTWQGRKVYAYETKDVTNLIEFPTGKLVARVRGTTPLESAEPPVGWNWPLWAGKSWTQEFRYTFHQIKQTFDVPGWWKVEAYEDIKVPAGTFKVFRIRYVDRGGETISWWSPDLGIDVKSWRSRLITHGAGPGTLETELVSYEIKK